jgi:hypothetical protein
LVEFTNAYGKAEVIGRLVITRSMIGEAKAEIDRKIRLRLAEEALRLPPDALAAGQYLDLPTFEQRGLYGTAAAVLVLSELATVDFGTAELLGKLNYYIVNRSQVERQAVSASTYRDYVARRIRLQKTDAFRLADVAFGLARVSPAVPNRSRALEFAISGVRAAKAAPFGFAVGPETAEPNPLATAHVLRCLVANNLPTQDQDWRFLSDYLDGGDDVYIKCFVVYVLSCYRPPASHHRLIQAWKELYNSLIGEFRRNSEANYEYTRYGEQDYVRIPWQLYLIQACARLFPLGRFNSLSVQSKLADIIRSAASTGGFRYEASGPYLSTRTHACLFQALTEIEEFNLSRPLPRAVVGSISAVTGVLSSRLFSGALYFAMAALAVWSILTWWQARHHSIAELAPNFLAEAVLLVSVWASVRVRRSRR